MEVWRGNYHVEVDRLGTVVIGIRIEIVVVSILVLSSPKVTAVNAKHDVSDPLGGDELLADEVVDELLGESNALLHLSFLHYNLLKENNNN